MAVLLVLVVTATVMLGGQIPGADPAPRQPASEGSASAAGIVTLLAVSMIVMAIALVFSLRNPPGPVPGRRELPRSAGGGDGPRSRRYLLLALGLAMVWVLALVLVNALTAGSADVEPPRVAGPGPAPGVTAPAASRGKGVGAVFGYLIATTVAFAVMVVLGAVVAARRPRPVPAAPLPEPSPPAGGAAGPDPLAVAAERGLAEVGNLSREPRAAIIACYAAMERELAGSPEAAPRDSDTPSEVLARAVRHHAVPAEGATALVELFTEARFSAHVMTEFHRERAENALRAVMTGLRATDVSSST